MLRCELRVSHLVACISALSERGASLSAWHAWLRRQGNLRQSLARRLRRTVLQYVVLRCNMPCGAPPPTKEPRPPARDVALCRACPGRENATCCNVLLAGHAPVWVVRSLQRVRSRVGARARARTCAASRSRTPRAYLRQGAKASQSLSTTWHTIGRTVLRRHAVVPGVGTTGGAQRWAAPALSARALGSRRSRIGAG